MEHPSFEFDGGLCHVMEDKIVFNQSTNPEERFGLKGENPIDRIFAQIFVAALIGIFGISLISPGFFDDGLYFILAIGLTIIIRWLVNYGTSLTQLIPLENLLYVKYRTYKIGKAFGYFVFHFKDGDGKKRKRYIIMKSFESGAGPTIEKAKSLLTTRGLLRT